MILIRVEAEVRPTEDVDKVKRAVLNILDLEKINVIDTGRGYSVIVGESNNIASLIKLYSLLRRERILDAARSVMLKSLVGNDTVVLKLHKQSAFVGRVSFITYDDESPLGAITITITSDKIREVIDWLAPKTSRGKPLWERGVPNV